MVKPTNISTYQTQHPSKQPMADLLTYMDPCQHRQIPYKQHIHPLPETFQTNTNQSTEPNWPSDYNRKVEWDTEKEADASASDKALRVLQIVQISPSRWARLSNQFLCPAVNGNIINVREKGFPFPPLVPIMDIPVESICTKHSLV